MSLFSLNYSDIDITEFAGIRERVLVMKPTRFSRRPDHTWSGIGSLQYLAHAYFTPKGQTGMHFHEQVDIVSIITRGEIEHQGSLGDGSRIAEEQVLVQCAGEQGFRHNEMNVNDDITGMVQIWIKPSNTTSTTQSHKIIDLEPETTHVYGKGSTFESETQITIKKLNAGQTVAINVGDFFYVLSGKLNHIDGHYERGCLMKSNQPEQLTCQSDVTLIKFTTTLN